LPSLHPSRAPRARRHTGAPAALGLAALSLTLAGCDPATIAEPDAAPVVDEPDALDLDAIDGRTFRAAPDRVLIRRRGTPEALRQTHARIGGSVIRELRNMPWQVVRLPEGMGLLRAMKLYGEDPAVDVVEPDYQRFGAQIGAPRFNEQWALQNTGQTYTVGGQSVTGTADVDVNASQAWGAATGAGTVIGMIDTGVNTNHPALSDNLWTNAGEIPNNGIDDDGNGWIDDVHGLAATGTLHEDSGHGTSVAGVMVANGDMIGLAPDAELITCAVGSTYYTSDIAFCLDYFRDLHDNHGVNIVTTVNSYGGTAASTMERDAIGRNRDSGILFVAAAGNDGYDNDERPTYPASYDVANILSVGAVDMQGNLADFQGPRGSNYGAHQVDMVAPGLAILTTRGNAYGYASGTSYAAPYVAAGAALLAEQNGSRTASQLRNLLLTSGKAVAGASSTVSGLMLRMSDTTGAGALDCNGASVEGRLSPSTSGAHYVVSGRAVTLRYLSVTCANPGAGGNVYVTAPNATVLLFDNGAGDDEVAGDGIYTGSWTPPEDGDHEVIFPDGDTLLVHSGPVIRDGASVAYSPETLTAPTEVTQLTGLLDAAYTIDLPFDVPFNSATYDKLSISTHGTVVFGTSSFMAYYNQDLSTSSLPSNLIAVYWDDLDLRETAPGNAGRVLTQHLDAGGSNERFVIEWNGARHYSKSGAEVTIQLVLFEDGSRYRINFVDTDHNNASWDDGASATVGIRVTNSYQLQYSYNASSVPSGTTVDFEVVAPWQNPDDRHDVSNDGLVTPRDALLVINRLNYGGGLPSLQTAQPPPFYDVNGDNYLSPLDALLVINELNRRYSSGSASVVDTRHPWEEVEDGSLYTNIAWNYAMGYHFTPLVDGTIETLGAFANGTKTVKLFEKDSGALLATTTVTGNNDWAFSSIGLVDVFAGTTYTVAVYLEGSGASYRYLTGDSRLPRETGGIVIEGTTYASTSSNPDARPTNTLTTRMYGMADIGFVPGGAVATGF
jgi:subtilisin family serine protease